MDRSQTTSTVRMADLMPSPNDDIISLSSSRNSVCCDGLFSSSTSNSEENTPPTEVIDLTIDSEGEESCTSPFSGGQASYLGSLLANSQPAVAPSKPPVHCKVLDKVHPKPENCDDQRYLLVYTLGKAIVSDLHEKYGVVYNFNPKKRSHDIFIDSDDDEHDDQGVKRRRPNRALLNRARKPNRAKINGAKRGRAVRVAPKRSRAQREESEPETEPDTKSECEAGVANMAKDKQEPPRKLRRINSSEDIEVASPASQEMASEDKPAVRRSRQMSPEDITELERQTAPTMSSIRPRRTVRRVRYGE